MKAGAGRDGRTRLARPNSQERTGSIDYEQDWQPYPVGAICDVYSSIYIHPTYPFWDLLFCHVFFSSFFLVFFVLFFVFYAFPRWSFVSYLDVPLIFSCSADHAPHWQPRKKSTNHSLNQT